MPTYRPSKDGHALERVQFSLEFAEQLSQELISAVDAQWSEWKASLPRRSFERGLLIPMGTKRNRPTAIPQQVTGVSYEFLQPDGTVSRGLRVGEQSIQYMMAEYTGWKQFWPEVAPVLKTVYGLLRSDENPLLALAVEYADVFLYDGPYDEFDASGIFKEHTSILPSHIFGRHLNWHAHTGYFDNLDDFAPHTRLTRMNIDVVDDDERSARIVRLNTHHHLRGRLVPFASDLSALPLELSEHIDDSFLSMHECNKGLLREILQPKMAEMIGLG